MHNDQKPIILFANTAIVLLCHYESILFEESKFSWNWIIMQILPEIRYRKLTLSFNFVLPDIICFFEMFSTDLCERQNCETDKFMAFLLTSLLIWVFMIAKVKKGRQSSRHLLINNKTIRFPKLNIKCGVLMYISKDFRSKIELPR